MDCCFNFLVYGSAWTINPIVYHGCFGRRGVSIGYLIPWSMLPDVIELDELETGQRREGIFYGFFVFMQKLGLSLGIAISNYVLSSLAM